VEIVPGQSMCEHHNQWPHVSQSIESGAHCVNIWFGAQTFMSELILKHEKNAIVRF